MCCLISVVPAISEMATKVDLRGAKDAKGNTALHFAAFKGYLQSCRFLVEESGIDVNSLSKTGAHTWLKSCVRPWQEKTVSFKTEMFYSPL
jgi:ankyrin repeat protein